MKTTFTKIGAFVLVIALAVGTAWFVGFNPIQDIMPKAEPATTTSSAVTV